MEKAQLLAAVEAAERVANGRKPTREAIGLSTDLTVTIAKAAVALDAVAALAADLLAARQHLFQVHDTPEAEAAAETAQDAALSHLAEALAALGYVTLQSPENPHGNAG